MKKNKKILIGILVVISLLIILPFFIPVKIYLNDAAKRASDQLGVPVTISSGHLLLLPTPRLVISEIKVGEGDALNVEQLTVTPSLTTIFSVPRVIDIHISKPTLKRSALEIMLAMTDAKTDTDAEANVVNVRSIYIDGLKFNWPGLKLPALNVEVSLLDGKRLSRAALESVDGALSATVVPESESHLIFIQAKKWTLPVGSPVLIDQAQIEMHLKKERLEVPRIDIDLYGGKLTANLDLRWHKDWRTNGKVKVEELSVKAPSKLISHAVYLSGKLAGNGQFSGAAKDAGNLVDNLNGSFAFKVHDGVVHGVDLVKLASLLTKQTAGGETAFDVFSGEANVKGKQYYLKNLKLSSGLLSGSGQVEIAANKELDGSGEVEIKHGVSLVAVPLDISGTLDSPVILPSKAAVAGAVAGTAILGPGLGTGVGIKAAGAIDKFKGLFKNE